MIYNVIGSFQTLIKYENMLNEEIIHTNIKQILIVFSHLHYTTGETHWQAVIQKCIAGFIKE